MPKRLGRVEFRVSAEGRERVVIQAQAEGVDLSTWIRRAMRFFLEVRHQEAQGRMVVVVDPRTGEQTSLVRNEEV